MNKYWQVFDFSTSTLNAPSFTQETRVKVEAVYFGKKTLAHSSDDKNNFLSVETM